MMVTNTTSRNWYQLLVMVLTVFWVADAWLSNSAQETITASFPAWSQSLWYGGLIAGALITAAGIMINTYVGLRVEQAGLLILTGLCIGYDIAFIAFAGRTNLAHILLVVPLIALFAVINFARARQIDLEIDTLRHGLRRLASPEAT